MRGAKFNFAHLLFQGWLFRVKMSKEAEEVKGLMDADGYKEYLKSQEDDQH